MCLSESKLSLKTCFVRFCRSKSPEFASIASDIPPRVSRRLRSPPRGKSPTFSLNFDNGLASPVSTRMSSSKTRNSLQSRPVFYAFLAIRDRRRAINRRRFRQVLITTTLPRFLYANIAAIASGIPPRGFRYLRSQSRDKSPSFDNGLASTV